MADPIRICIVNRNYPPVHGATGYHAHQLVQYLLKTTDFIIHVVTSGIDKDDNKDRVKITYCSEYYNGSNAKLRLLGATRSAYKLIKKAQQLRADFYIIMTDPPILNYWAARIFKKERWALWTMDLYPDAFVAGGLISESSIVVSHYRSVIQKNQPELLITLGDRQSKYLRTTNYSVTDTIHWPVGIRESEDDSRGNEYPDWYDDKKITFGYLGNLGEAHDPEWLLLLAELLDPHRHQLVISCGGKHRDLVLDTLASNSAVVISEYIPAAFIECIDIHIVILRPKWTHICVPSKAISAIQHGGAILFCGRPESDTWHYVKESGWQLSHINELENCLSHIDQSQADLKKAPAEDLFKRLNEQRLSAYDQLVRKIRKLDFEVNR